MTDIADRWRTIRARVDAACAAAGRPTDSVTIIAVSKTHPAAAVRAAAAAGAIDFGENYAQELALKRPDCPPELRWHFIGRLQRNKAKLVAGQVALVHAVDSLELARELAKRADGRLQPILISVNVAGEATKGGVEPEAVTDLARDLALVQGIRLDGLMTMPPPSEDPEASRPAFDALRGLRDRVAQALGQPLPVLSMGMSDDFEVAIACGATHVRIGTAIFGEREAP
ncbi:MAG: YggS family pyridoxal phosphate-dependent enzyme [Deltaproteobacteria bacterium]|nr:YggS family pyridoxal phosphate-dependent enzyme [Deltaproteobacteria bacterium]MDQ3296374.1 YggS family pyridoxal phosphate-dependent enzyme [Myxococcota bacterium]